MAPTDLLLVEGLDDEQVFVHLFNHYQLPLSEPDLDESGKIAIRRAGGFQQLRQSLPIRFSIVETRHIGIVVDADTVPSNRWTSLRAALADAGYLDLPHSIASAGTVVVQANLPTVGIWLMPNNVLPGALENFAYSLIRDNDTLWNHVEASVEAIPDDERLWQPVHLMKAKMHTWLAWQEEPGAPMGLAIKKGYLKADALQVAPLVAWIRNVFELPS